MSNPAAPARPWAGATGRTRPGRRCRISNHPDRPNPPWLPACASSQSDRSICHWQIAQTVLWLPVFTGCAGDQRRVVSCFRRPPILLCFLPNLTRVKFGIAPTALALRLRFGQSDRSTCHWQVAQTVLWPPTFMGGAGDPRRPALPPLPPPLSLRLLCGKSD